MMRRACLAHCETTNNLFSVSFVVKDHYCIAYSQPGADNKRFNLTRPLSRSGRLVRERILPQACLLNDLFGKQAGIVDGGALL